MEIYKYTCRKINVKNAKEYAKKVYVYIKKTIK